MFNTKNPFQKDTAREVGAELASLKSIVWVCLALFVDGLASLFYPALKLISGRVATSVAATVGEAPSLSPI